MCRQTMVFPMHMRSGFPTGRFEQMIMTSLCDIMRISHAVKGGNYKRESMTEPQGWAVVLSSGCSGTKHLGLLASHIPSTLVVSVPLKEEA